KTPFSAPLAPCAFIVSAALAAESRNRGSFSAISQEKLLAGAAVPGSSGAEALVDCDARFAGLNCPNECKGGTRWGPRSPGASTVPDDSSFGANIRCRG